MKVKNEMHDPQTIATLKQLFDGIIEIQSSGGGYAMQVVGLLSKPTPWFDYEINGVNISMKEYE